MDALHNSKAVRHVLETLKSSHAHCESAGGHISQLSSAGDDGGVKLKLEEDNHFKA